MAAANVDHFREAIVNLHRQKDASYGDSWKRRGELISIMANIARKVDRIELAGAGQVGTADENVLDTAIDLYVYTLKYLTYLADADKAVASKLFGDQAGPYSDGTLGVEVLIADSDPGSAFAEMPQRSFEDQVGTVVATFSRLEDCFAGTGPASPPETRAETARTLEYEALNLIATISYENQGLFDKFVAEWGSTGSEKR